MSAALARLASLLDLDQLTPGERTQWTVRAPHGIYLVELEQFVSGTRVRLDRMTVGHSAAWSFPSVPFRFAVGPSAATLAVRPDTQAGTVRATLIVGGARIAPDAPAWRRRQVPPIPWAGILARAGYALGVLLISAAAVGDPYRAWVVGALNTALDVAWIAAVRGIDPFGLLPAWLAAATSSRAALLLLGLEIAGLVALAREPRLRARVPGVRSGGRAVRAAAWSALVVAAAVLPTLLAG